MDLELILRNEERRLFAEVQRGAAGHDAETVVTASESLKRIEDLLGDYRELEARVEQMVAGLRAPPRSHGNGKAVATRRCLSRQAFAALRRTRFVARLAEAGIALEPIKGRNFRVPGGERVMIAFTSQARGGRWWFGLRDGEYDGAILLCEEGPTDVAIALPRDFFVRYGDGLSHAGDDTKLNVSRRHAAFYMTGPGIGELSLEPYREQFEHLKAHAPGSR